MTEPLAWLTLEPDGRIVLPEAVIRDVVMETLGCGLWFNDKDLALGLRLLRNVDDPPYLIERDSGPEGITGRLEAGEFLKRAGYGLPAEPRRLPCWFHEKFTMLEIRLAGLPGPVRPTKTGILDDYPALED